MAQQQVNATQTQQTTQKPVVSQQPVGQTQQAEAQGATSIWKKWWLWVIIGLVVIGIGVGVWFLFFK